jgi:hypothetical protein
MSLHFFTFSRSQKSFMPCDQVGGGFGWMNHRDPLHLRRLLRAGNAVM